jgi:hypothetical protein
MKKLLASILILSLVVACKKEAGKPVPSEIDTVTRIKPLDSAAIAKEKVKKEGDIKKINDEVLQALKNKDYKTFATFIHPKKGITFSMYAFVDPKTDKHFSKEDFEKYQPTKTLFTWGAWMAQEILIKLQSMIILENGCSPAILPPPNILMVNL